nr:DUF2809 domain-containing protein [Planomicrobium sp. CPCC 101079]
MIGKSKPLNFLNSHIRWTYLLAIGAVVVLGLASRIYGNYLPSALSENAGDILWAMMVYFGFRFLMADKSIPIAISLSLLFSFGIEFTQLYQADWIVGIRSSLLGALVLGHGFLWVDLIRYSIGILLASLSDRIFIRMKTADCRRLIKLR